MLLFKKCEFKTSEVFDLKFYVFLCSEIEYRNILAAWQCFLSAMSGTVMVLFF